MKVICFRGASKTGKSTIIKRILTNLYKINLITSSRKDFSLILDNKGLKIGLCSYGDRKEILEKNLKPLKDKKCNIIVCACHPNGETFDYIIKEFGEKVLFIDCNKVNSDKIESNTRKKLKEFKKIMCVKDFWRREYKEGSKVIIFAISEAFLILAALLLEPFFPSEIKLKYFIIALLAILGAVGIRWGIKEEKP